MRYRANGKFISREKAEQLLAEGFQHIDGNFSVQAPKAAEKPEPEKPEPEKPEKPLIAGNVEAYHENCRDLGNYETFVFSVVQNNTEPHLLFLRALENFCDRNNARLVLGCSVYNKNGFQNGTTDKEKVYFHPAFQQYIVNERRRVCDGLLWLGEYNILPTVKYPLSGMDQVGGQDDIIIPASKIALESVAAPKGIYPKFMYATGALTQRNYIQKKTGQIAEDQHNYGALVVHVCRESGNHYAFQIETDHTGAFQHMREVYHPDGAVTAGDIVAVNLGDLHCEKMDKAVLDGCCDMLDYLRPDYIICHDTFDMMAANHHNRGNPHFRARMAYAGNSVKRDLEVTGNILHELQGYGQLVIVESNHDLALQKWLEDERYDFRYDSIDNAKVYLTLQSYTYETLGEKEPRILEHALGELGNCNTSDIIFLETDQSFQKAGIELGYHGHSGLNGSRGSPKQFQKLSMPVNTGHTHSCSIYGKVYTAGVTGSLDMGYNIGPSSWSHSHIVTYATGFRTIVTMKPRGDNWWWRQGQ